MPLLMNSKRRDRENLGECAYQAAVRYVLWTTRHHCQWKPPCRRESWRRGALQRCGQRLEFLLSILQFREHSRAKPLLKTPLTRHIEAPVHPLQIRSRATPACPRGPVRHMARPQNEISTRAASHPSLSALSLWISPAPPSLQ